MAQELSQQDPETMRLQMIQQNLLSRLLETSVLEEAIRERRRHGTRLQKKTAPTAAPANDGKLGNSSSEVDAIREEIFSMAQQLQALRSDHDALREDFFRLQQDRTVSPTQSRKSLAGQVAGTANTSPRAAVQRCKPGIPVAPQRQQPSARRKSVEGENESGDLYQIAEPLLRGGATVAARKKVVDAVAEALDNGTSARHWAHPGTPLRAAVEHNSLELAEVLIKDRPDFEPASPNEADDKGVTVLHMATYQGNAELCKLLLRGRADANKPDSFGQTPLFFVPSVPICEVLCGSKADVNVRNEKGQSALHLAARSGLRDVLVWLTSSKHLDKNLATEPDLHGATMTYYARHAGIPFSLTSDLVGPKKGKEVASPKDKVWKPGGLQTGWKPLWEHP